MDLSLLPRRMVRMGVMMCLCVSHSLSHTQTTFVSARLVVVVILSLCTHTLALPCFVLCFCDPVLPSWLCCCGPSHLCPTTAGGGAFASSCFFLFSRLLFVFCRTPTRKNERAIHTHTRTQEPGEAAEHDPRGRTWDPRIGRHVPQKWDRAVFVGGGGGGTPRKTDSPTRPQPPVLVVFLLVAVVGTCRSDRNRPRRFGPQA